MIIEFSVKNYRSIKDLQTISFLASKLDSNQDKYPDVDSNNIVIDNDIKLLKTVGIYGANASGKSNIIRAFDYFLQAIGSEASPDSKLNSLCDPYLYQENAIDTESFFQIILLIEGKKYRYGFTVKKNISAKENESKEIITNEWLYGPKEKNALSLFDRQSLNINKEKLPGNDKIPPLQYEHNLFLTHAAAFDKNSICALIRKDLSLNISNFIHGFDYFKRNTIIYLKNHNQKATFLNLLSSFNLKYNGITIKEDPKEPNSFDLPHENIFLFKEFINKENKIEKIKLNLAFNESSGTRKLFDLAGLLLIAFNLNSSALIIIDEIDSDFHPSLLIKLINLFNNPLINKSNSQLLFTSHDTNLMTPELMRRDQFYFTEKDENDATKLFSLANLKGIRNDADFARQYLAGIYGALPGFKEFIFENIDQSE